MFHQQDTQEYDMATYILNGITIKGIQFTHDNRLYPYNWCEIATEADKEAIGIITLIEIFPYLEEGEEYDGTYSDDLVFRTRIYNKYTAVE